MDVLVRYATNKSILQGMSVAGPENMATPVTPLFQSLGQGVGTALFPFFLSLRLWRDSWLEPWHTGLTLS